VITVSTLARPHTAPRVRPGRRLASVDVEWTKNYRITNGNQPFCVSVVWLDLPGHRRADLARLSWQYTSLYLEPGEPTATLVEAADRLLTTVLASADLVCGHQVSSDFAVLAATAGRPAPAVEQARAAWHRRRDPAGAELPAVLDTRYDAGHLLTGRSRRLVDVAAELDLDVTQPELRGTSMTALHRTWLTSGDDHARERISVLNLRHSLSTGLIAARAADLGTWPADQPLNVNQLIADRAAGAWDWLRSPTFTALL
jgi:hypothetical protein